MTLQTPLMLSTASEEQTGNFGYALGKLLEGPTVILLTGQLGTGKSVLARGIARGMGITDPVRSPTFTLVNKHQGRLPLYHCDLYRLEPSDMRHLGMEEMMEHSVLIVEWAEKWLAAPPDALCIDLVSRDNFRSLKIVGPERLVSLCKLAKEESNSDPGH